MEKIFDLVAASERKAKIDVEDKKLKMRESLERGVYVQGLLERAVHSPEEILAMIRAAEKVRVSATTQMNERSSRSHMVVTIMVSLHVGFPLFSFFS